MLAEMHRIELSAFVTIVSCLAAAASQAAVGTTRVIVNSGRPVPDGNGVFDIQPESLPVLNDAGQAAFYSYIGDAAGGGNDEGLYRGGDSLTKIVRLGDAAPDGNGAFDDFESLLLNDRGQSAFRAALRGTAAGTADNSGIYLRTDDALVEVVRENGPVPGGIGTFASFPDSRGITLNDAGQVGFYARIGLGNSTAVGGIFRGDGASTVEIVREGDPVPDGSGLFGAPASPFLNDAGQIAFAASFTTDFGFPTDDGAIFRGDQTGLTQIARIGQTTPVDGRRLASLDAFLDLNDSGQVAFNAAFERKSDSTAATRAVFVGDGNGLTEVVRSGRATPDGERELESFFPPILNESGQVALYADLVDTLAGPFDDRGIYVATVGDDDVTLAEVAREGQAAPGSGRFSFVGSPAFNDAGQVAFAAQIDLDDGGSANDETGLYLYDADLGLLTVARTGDRLRGGRIDNLWFESGLPSSEPPRRDEGSGLNNRGEVAYAYRLDDGRYGVAVWSVPEPASATVPAAACLGLVRVRRRRRSRSTTRRS